MTQNDSKIPIDEQIKIEIMQRVKLGFYITDTQFFSASSFELAICKDHKPLLLLGDATNDHPHLVADRLLNNPDFTALLYKCFGDGIYAKAVMESHAVQLPHYIVIVRAKDEKILAMFYDKYDKFVAGMMSSSSIIKSVYAFNDFVPKEIRDDTLDFFNEKIKEIEEDEFFNDETTEYGRFLKESHEELLIMRQAYFFD